MTHKLAADKSARTYHYEALEERLALTTHALADLPELTEFSGIDSSITANSLRGVADPEQHIDYVRDHYSLDGSGQTVAIIDSGIAWDHYALGGGFGEDFRVVGGWDFAENDSNPFDDGPAGFHGTHVAGIVGSDDAEYEGVASGVDLVGLRVFDDMGNGRLEWVEQALRWVHEHQNDFQNPITTVNLSLGVNWNSNSVPVWATLEDELLQLKNDGIFVSVAAGNSFQNYLTKGVSYPAASKSVVPVASHDSRGQLSDFSQRNERVLVAPGENVVSTIPAHLYGQRGPSSNFMATSGTSMAAPWAAGASTLLREAFEIAGENNIDQESLFRHFHETADRVYDSITRTWYSRLNLAAAIDAALEDGHGDQMHLATSMGTVSKVTQFEGILAKANDVDYLRFSADEGGRVTLTLNSSHDLETQLNVVGRSVSRNGNTISFDVQAGSEFLLQLSSRSGQGNYQIEVDFESSQPTRQDLGLIRSNRFQNLKTSGESWFKFTAARESILTVEALIDQTHDLAFEIYDANLQLVSRSAETFQGLRTDFLSSAGESYSLRIIGSSTTIEFDLKLTNLVRINGDRIIAGGTGQADNYIYSSLENQHLISVNGTSYRFSKSDFGKVRINGGTGQDHLQLTGSDRYENLSGSNGQIVFFGSETDVVSRNFESMDVYSNGGNDLAVLGDSSASDYFRGTSSRASLVGGGYSITVNGFDRVTAISRNGGNDRADLIGSTGNDFLHIHDQGTSLAGQGFQNYVIGFDDVTVTGGSGFDNVIARGTGFSERLTFTPTQTSYRNVQGLITFDGFSDLVVKSGGGVDRAAFHDVQNGDRLYRFADKVEGTVFGNQVSIEEYPEVLWSPAVNTNPSVGLSAIEEVFEEYADRC